MLVLNKLVKWYLGRISKKLEKELLTEWDQDCKVLIQLQQYDTYNGFQVVVSILIDEDDEEWIDYKDVDLSDLEDKDSKKAQTKIENFARKIFCEIFY